MADGSVKNVIGGTFEDIGEAVVKPTVDEVGKALETGIQSIVQGPKPFDFAQGKQQQQQKLPDSTQNNQVEDKKKMAEARRKLAYWEQIEEAQRKVREEERQKQLQRQQQTQQQKQEKQQIKQFQIVKKTRELHPAIAAKGKVEIKRGVGG